MTIDTLPDAMHFLTPPQPPPLFTGTPLSIVDNIKRLIEHSRKLQDQITETVEPDTARFANVLQPLAHAANAMAVETNILCFYRSVSMDAKLRDASSEAQKLLDEYYIETATREDLYGLVDALVKRKETENLDGESLLLLDKRHKEYIRNGLTLPRGAERDRFKEIRKRISQLGLEYRNNVNEERGGIWFTSQELLGLNDDVLTRLEKKDGRGDIENRYRLTFKDQDIDPMMRDVRSGETRKRYYIARENRCNQNISIFKEVIILRQEAAHLIGYTSHAAFRLEAKMAKKPETVDSFLQDLRSRLIDSGQKEIDQLKQIKKADLESRGESFDGRFFLWDQSFYNRMMMENQHSVNGQKIKEYFPLQTTIRGMLVLFQELFGLVFREITGVQRDELAESRNGSDLVWHEDVELFSVWDDDVQGGDFLGYLYLDLFSRDGKYGNASNFNLQPGFIQEDGTRRYPATALLCSFPQPTFKKPSLLSHWDVVMMFHELGHGIHDLVSKTLYARFHGTQTVIDFGEAPSQMLENWCWTPGPLKSLSRHYSYLSAEYYKQWSEQAEGEAQPPEQMPDSMIENLIAAKNVNGALFNLRQLHLGIFDLAVHDLSSREAIEKLDFSEYWNDLRKQLLQVDGPEVLGQGYGWGHGQATFGHLMGDYDTGYYGYLWSEVYSTDMFYAAFRADPMNAKEGRRYRYTVLEKGGSQDEMKMLVDFLGREPTTEAFHKSLGLA